MILVYCPEAAHASLLAKLGATATIGHTWTDIDRGIHKARKLVAIAPVLDHGLVRSWQGIRHRFPAIPGLICTEYTQANARLLVAVTAERLVWLRDAEADLPEAINRLAIHDYRGRLAEAIVGFNGLDVVESRLLLRLVTLVDPPHSLKQWAAASCCSISTIKYHGRMSGRTRVRPLLLVNVNLLLASMDRVPHPKNWNDLACAVGVDHRRLKRTAAQLLSEPAPDVRAAEPGRLLAAACLLFAAGEPSSIMPDQLGTNMV